jgi:hypothetical protein
VEYDMKFSNEMAASLGLSVGGKAGSALVNPVFGFAGRRIYIDGGSRANNLAGPTIHLSGFTAAEVESLGGVVNTAGEYSRRVTGFLPLNPANLAAASKIVREATSAAYEPSNSKVMGVDVAAIFAAASKPEEKPTAPTTDEVEAA